MQLLVAIIIPFNISLTASKDSDHHWIAVVTQPNDGQHHETMHLLAKWKAGAPFMQISDIISTALAGDQTKMCSYFLSSGRYVDIDY